MDPSNKKLIISLQNVQVTNSKSEYLWWCLSIDTASDYSIKSKINLISLFRLAFKTLTEFVHRRSMKGGESNCYCYL